MEKVRILSVGIGGYAVGYLQALLNEENPNFEFAGIVDVAPERSACYPMLQERGVPLYSSMEEFYAVDKADLAIIVTPIHLHTPMILCALRNGSNVMCEKPLSGVSADEELIQKAIDETGKFVIIGFQWSYSKGILDLKEDISSGLFGKAEMLKCRVFWPRSKEYFKRGTGWGGRIHAANGAIINDSVVNNATAHYIHNILFVTGGAHGKSSEAVDVECDLLRVNDIENFDTAVARFKLTDGTPCLYVVSHSTYITDGPDFEYRFEKATITFDGTNGLVARFKDGTAKQYSDPFADSNRKVFDAIAHAKETGYEPVCSAKTAAPQVRFVEKVQQNPIYNVRKELIHEEAKENGNYLYVEGLDDLLNKCYNEEKILRDYPELKGMVEA